MVTGIRRCGKSYLLKEIYAQYLKDSGVSTEAIIAIDLDDDKNTRLRDPLELGTAVRALCAGKHQCCVFIDEIQDVFPLITPALTGGAHVPAKKSDQETVTFTDTLLGLSQEKNLDLYITGSNSKMLASDIATQFRDKAVNISMAPLSFAEFHRFSGKSPSEDLCTYMRYGGMPLAVLKDEDGKREYLKGLFEASYFPDIIERKHLRRSAALEELCDILAVTAGSLVNSGTLANAFKGAGHGQISKLTAEHYLGCLKDVFLLREARRFDLKERKEIGAQRKYYFCDTGLRNARLNFAFPDEGQMLENIIYNEMICNGFSVDVGTFDSVDKNHDGKSVRNRHEIDFYTTKGRRALYVQVCFDLANAQTRQRKIRPFFLLNDQVQKILVINRPVSESRDENGFTVIGVTDFLLRFLKH
ncbi:MAG: ATP-binding protein [Succinivibrio sp.]|nr:ATP-binding protein [Succinivibrio sp.]